ncbi:MAG: gamma-glutamyl-gamma-aminobutyrate hydrolase family protein [Ferruginibacter sp.]
MKRQIKIGLTYTGTAEKHNNYVTWLKTDDDISVVKLSAEDNNLDVVKEMDGIVLSGGLDIHPKYYGNNKSDYANAPECFNEQRDEFEKTVFEISQQHNIPVLGVCRGMQLVNCLLGGSLTQDIGNDSNITHRFDEIDKVHGVNLLPDTMLHQIINTDSILTNSAHHQSVNGPGKGLKINAMSDDGIVEGIERADSNSKPFFLGIQWHPERMFKSGLAQSPATINIRERFLSECFGERFRVKGLE